MCKAMKASKGPLLFPVSRVWVLLIPICLYTAVLQFEHLSLSICCKHFVLCMHVVIPEYL